MPHSIEPSGEKASRLTAPNSEVGRAHVCWEEAGLKGDGNREREKKRKRREGERASNDGGKYIKREPAALVSAFSAWVEGK